MKLSLKILLLTAAFLTFSTSLYAAEEKLRFAVSDIAGLEELQREFKEFKDKLASFTGYEIELYPVTSRTAAVEALKFKSLDFILTGPAEYVIIHQRAKAVPVVGFQRPNYNSAIIVKADSGITEPEQLKGKSIGLGDIGSTSYYLAPLRILKNNGLEPQKDYKVHHISKQIAWASLKRGSLPAIGFSYMRFLDFVEADDEVKEGDFRVLIKGEALPNDVLVAGAHIKPEIISKVRKVFVEESVELIEAIKQGERNNKYDGMEFVPDVTDEDYNPIREMYAIAGYPEYLKSKVKG